MAGILGGARSISCSSLLGVAGCWASWASSLEASLASAIPQRASSSVSVSKGVGPTARGLLCEIHLRKKLFLRIAEHLGILCQMRSSEAFCLPRVGGKKPRPSSGSPLGCHGEALWGGQLLWPPNPQSCLNAPAAPSVHVSSCLPGMAPLVDRGCSNSQR